MLISPWFNEDGDQFLNLIKSTHFFSKYFYIAINNSNNNNNSYCYSVYIKYYSKQERENRGTSNS
jgi:hypothetical protein